MFSSLGGIKKREPLFTFKKKTLFATTDDPIYKPVLFSTDLQTNRLVNATNLSISPSVASSIFTSTEIQPVLLASNNTNLPTIPTKATSISNSKTDDDPSSKEEKCSNNTITKVALNNKNQDKEDEIDKENINENTEDDVFDFASAIDEYGSKELKLMVASNRPVPKKPPITRKRSKAKKTNSPCTSCATNNMTKKNAGESKATDAVIDKPHDTFNTVHKQKATNITKPLEPELVEHSQKLPSTSPEASTTKDSAWDSSSSVSPPICETLHSNNRTQEEPYDIFAFDPNPSTRLYDNNRGYFTNATASNMSVAYNDSNVSYQLSTHNNHDNPSVYSFTNMYSQPMDNGTYCHRAINNFYHDQLPFSTASQPQQSLPTATFSNNFDQLPSIINPFDLLNVLNPAPTPQHSNANVYYPSATHIIQTAPTFSAAFTATPSTIVHVPMTDMTTSTVAPPKPSTTLSSSSSSTASSRLGEPKKRKRNLVSHLKSATGEKSNKSASKKDIDYIFSDEEDSLIEHLKEEQIDNPPLPLREIINKERSLSPELTHGERMELQLKAIMRSEFGESDKSDSVTEDKEVIKRRPRYEPLNKVNVRVTFQKPHNTNTTQHIDE
ncbi:hypothetical protein BDF20DRAFT_37101 [Mycotypha africana]|uniref:uncharacterized protein n=1 Tax=Mycotypha africana TaxID=64632 RepID=UPI0023018A0A|nr:uncharacterized protein BDF20DRAFT_37101 [Mycotypha africana]KAI8991347.1 hypothetical protein BDF20DRAFT_37101 [Mycotypha africana]